MVQYPWDPNNEKDFSYGTMPMNGCTSPNSSSVGEPSQAPPGGIEAAINRNKQDAKIQQSKDSESKAVRTWRNITGLAICILFCLTLVTVIVESVRIANDDNNSNGQMPENERVSPLYFIEREMIKHGFEWLVGAS